MKKNKKQKENSLISFRTLLLTGISCASGITSMAALYDYYHSKIIELSIDAAEKAEFLTILNDKLFELANGSKRLQNWYWWNIKIHPDCDPLWMLRNLNIE